MSDLSQFLEELHEEVQSLQVATDGDAEITSELKFTELIADELAEYGAVDSVVPCVLDVKTGKGRVRCSGYHIDEEAGRIDLFVAFYRSATEGDTITQTDIRAGFERARRIVQLIEEGLNIVDAANTDQAAMVSAIREACPTAEDVRIIILSDCAARDTTEINEPFGRRNSRCLIWDATRLLRVRNSGREYEAVEIDLTKFNLPDGLPCLAMPESNCGYRTFLTLIPGQLLYRLYDEYGARLLQLNVRSFLQVRGKVNKGMRQTILNQPARFLAYNNGITATVEEINCNEGGSSPLVIKKLKGFQVVNGGQTVATLHHAAKTDKASLDEIWVQAKISAIDETLMKQLVPEISRYSNTQNRINEADFSSNDRFHIRLEELSDRIWTPGERSRWFYERARGQYQVAKARASTTPAKRKKFLQEVPTGQKFSKTDLTKYLNSWAQHPELVSRGAQKNFTAYMDSIAQSSSPVEQDERWYRHIIAKVILFKTAESVARSLKISAYRANAVTYTVATLSYRTLQRVDLDRIWEIQSVTEATRKAIELWMPAIIEEIISSSAGRNVTEWCKKPECWRHVQTIDLPIPKELEQELADGQPLPNVGRDATVKNLQLNQEDRENLAKVMLIPDSVWLDIHKWGVENDNLKVFESGIAHTLVAYAAGGWSKVPSRKQAKFAAGIIEKARGHVGSLDQLNGP